MRHLTVVALLLGVALAVPAASAADLPVPSPIPEAAAPVTAPHDALAAPDCTASALPVQGNSPDGPLGPPPVPPGNACEARCIQEFASCQQICSRFRCLIPCETVYEICTSNC